MDFGSANAPWSAYKNSITTVVIDDIVTSIGKKAFSGCSSLEQVTIGKNVKTISSEAFTDCRKLRDVTFADKESIETIESGAFRHCDQLTEIMSSEVPLASEDGAEIMDTPAENGHWALANLVLLAAAIIAASQLFCYLYTKSGSKFEFFHKKC